MHLRIILAGVVLGLSATLAVAQDPTATNPDQIGPYSVTSSLEVGWRGLRVEGNENTYKSDLNYEPGFKFNDSSLLLRTEPGTGTLFDTLLVHVTGWDADPYGYIRVDADKLDWYTFNSTVRRSTYYNALPNIALGEHRDDTRHTFGDFNLTLLPTHRPLRLNVGYAFDQRSGPTTSTTDYSRDEFPMLAPARMHTDTYTFGFDSTLGLWDISFLQGFRHYKDDAVYTVDTFEGGNSGPFVPPYLNYLDRNVPARGQINFSRVNVHTFLNNMVDITGRFVYSHAKTDSTYFETLSGADYLGTVVNLDQTSANASVERPDVIADLGVTITAMPQMRISNTFRYNWFKIDGAQTLNEQLITSPSGAPPASGFSEANVQLSRLTKYRLFTNLIELDYEFHPRISAHVGYRYTDRSTDFNILDLDLDNPETAEPEMENFDNRTNTFIFGLYAKPLKERWSLYFDVEKGEADNVFTRTANYDYWNLRLRNLIHVTDEITLNLSAITRQNNNPTRTQDIPPVNFGADTDARIFSASGDWVPNSRFSLSSGYTYSHIDSDADILFFLNYQFKSGTSQYFARDNYAYINVNAQIAPRVALYGAYNFHNDTGAGDRLPDSELTFISALPYRYQTPEIRLSFKIHSHIEAILGYQYYKYEERFKDPDPAHPLNRQDYSAHLPYGSLRFTFGGDSR